MLKIIKSKESGLTALEFSIAAGAAAIIIGVSSILPAEASEPVEDKNILAAMLDELQDINIEEPIAGDTLVWDGESWVNGILNLTQLGSTDFTSPQEGDVLMFDGENWFNSTPAAPTLENLIGVNIDGAPGLGNSLIWDGTEWVDATSGISGEIKLWTASETPDGWLIADGSAVSRSTYSELFSTIGLTYGAGDGSTTFNLPDLKGNVPVGFDSTQTEFNTLGKTGGQKTVTLTEAQMPTHTHTQQAHGHAGIASDGGAHGHNASTNSGGSHAHTGTSNTTGNHSHTYQRGNGGNSNYNKRSTGCCGTSGTFGKSSASAGAHTHTVTATSAGSHTHTVTVTNGGSHSHDISTSNTTAVNNSAGDGAGHGNLMPYTTVDYIIRY